MQRVTKAARCPVLIINRPCTTCWNLFSNIIFCTDFSKTADAAFAFARNTAQEIGAKLYLFHAFGQNQPPGLFLHETLQMVGVGRQPLLEIAPFPGPGQGKSQQGVVDGLGEEIRGPEAQALDGQLHIPVAGGHDHFGIRIKGLDRLEQADAVKARHPDVRDHDSGAVPRKKLQGFPAVGGEEGDKPRVRQHDGHHRADAGFVIGEKDGFRHPGP